MISWIPSEIRWLYGQVRPFLRWHIATFFCISAGSFLALSAPLVLKWLIDVVLPGRRVGPLLGAVGLIFLCYQGRAVLTGMGGYLTMRAAQRLALDMRLGLLRHLDALSADYHEGTPVGASMYP
jgi:ABC-type bacteriocin/lantibiotic exporter with double-glycine peptidase domain